MEGVGRPPPPPLGSATNFQLYYSYKTVEKILSQWHFNFNELSQPPERVLDLVIKYNFIGNIASKRGGHHYGRGDRPPAPPPPL